MATSAVSAGDNSTDETMTVSCDEVLTATDDGSFSALNDKISFAGENSEINLTNDYYYRDGDNLQDGIDIDVNNITINGNGFTISGNGKASVFNIYAQNVILKNINFINCKSNYGGVINSQDATYEIINCRFTNNSGKDAGAIFDNTDDWSFVSGSIINSTFINNDASGMAGAVYVKTIKSFVNCTFINNTASSSGAIFSYGDEITIERCVFIGNDAMDAAAVHAIYSRGDISNSIIISDGSKDTVMLGSDLTANSNWWGNTDENYTRKPSVSKGNVNMDNWIFLNVTGIPDKAIAGDGVTFHYALKLFNGSVGDYDSCLLPEIRLNLSSLNCTLDKESALIGEDIACDSINGCGRITAEYGGISYSKSVYKLIPTEIIVNDTFELVIGNIADLGAVLIPAGAGNLSYVSDDSSVVDVDDYGVITAIGSGIAKITISFAGTGQYSACNATATVNVSKIATYIDVNSHYDLTIGDVVDLNAVLTPADAGNLSYVSDNPDVVRVDNGVITALSNGVSNVTVSFVENNRYKGSNATVTVSIKLIHNTDIRVTVIDGLKLTAVLLDDGGNPLSSLSVSYDIDGGEKNTLTTGENGEFTFDVESNCVVNMNFAGNNEFKGCNASIILKNIVPKQLSTEIIAENPFTRTAVDYKAGERGYMFYFTLKDENGKVLPNKKVKIGIDGKIYTVTTDKDGRAGQMINMANENSYTYALCFLGDDDYKASFAVSRLIVVKKAVTITPAKTSYTFASSAKTKTVTATLKSTNSYIPKGKQVTLTIAGKTFKSTIGDKGQISFNIGSVTAKGTYKVTIKFDGTVTYSSATSKTITVKIT